MIIDRSEYVNLLLAKRWNGKVKIVTGIRRSGKSFLLSTLFKNRLLDDGVSKDDFIENRVGQKVGRKIPQPEPLV